MMPDTPDHRVEMYKLASGRSRRGLPVWAETINVGDVFHNEELTFEERRFAIVARIQASKWYKRENKECGELVYVLDDLASAEDEDEFDSAWDEIYDLADYARVWIHTSHNWEPKT